MQNCHNFYLGGILGKQLDIKLKAYHLSMTIEAYQDRYAKLMEQVRQLKETTYVTAVTERYSS